VTRRPSSSSWGSCPPRYGTERNLERATIGPDVEAAAVILTGAPFMPWQRHVTDIAGEIDPATGLLHYEIVVLVVPRQQGKTTALEPKLVHAARRRPDVDVVYTAQDRQMARRRLLDDLVDKRLARCRPLAGHWKARRSNGSEGIRWSNGSQITTVANTDEAGHGLTLDLAVIDEAFSHPDLTVVTALEPTTITRPDPQVWIVSTIGDGTDGLLLHYQDIGLAALADPTTRVAYFEWSATEHDDRMDPAVWARVMPALGRTITTDRIRSRFATLDPGVIDRAYLCRRPTAELVAPLPPAAWATCAVPDTYPAPPYVIAVTVNASRTLTSIAVAGAGSEAGRVSVVVDTRPGVTWAAPAVVELAGRLRADEVVADRRGGAGSIIDAATHLGRPVRELGPGDVVTYAGTFHDLVTDLELEHPADELLDIGAARAVTRPLGEAWAWDGRRSPVEVAPLVAATNAAGAHRERFGPIAAAGGRIY
jgi:hypothetical protein